MPRLRNRLRDKNRYTEMKRISVRAIMRTPDNRFCFIHRIKHGDEYWVTPGGGIEPGEDAVSALKREMIEETGSHIALDSQTPAFTFENETHIQHFYLCREISRTEPTGDEHKISTADNSYTVAYLSLNEMQDIRIAPDGIKDKIISYARLNGDIQRG